MHHHILLYTDDTLLYVDNPVQSVPQILSIFWTLQQAFWFQNKQAEIDSVATKTGVAVATFIPVTKNFNYLGIEISSLIQTIIKQNFGNTLNKITADLDRWSNLPNSRQSQTSIGKKNILPRVDFVSSMVPLPLLPQYWSKLQSAITKFLWWGKRPHIKLTTMQRGRQASGLSFPNFKLYNWALTLRPLQTWFQSMLMCRGRL